MRITVTLVHLIVLTLNPLLLISSVLEDVGSAVTTLLHPVKVNSQSWRRNVAKEIYELMDKNTKKLITNVSLDITRRFRITVDHLKLIANQLENFESRIYLYDQNTRNVLLFFFVSCNIIKTICFGPLTILILC